MTVTRFTIAYWCVLVAAILPIVSAGIAKVGMFSTPKREGGFDNNNPRSKCVPCLRHKRWSSAITLRKTLP